MKKIGPLIFGFFIFCIPFVKKEKKIPLLTIKFLKVQGIREVFNYEIKKEDFSVVFSEKGIEPELVFIIERVAKFLDTLGVDVLLPSDSLFLCGGNLLKNLIDTYNFFIPSFNIKTDEEFIQKYVIKKMNGKRIAFLFTAPVLQNFKNIQKLPMDSLLKVYTPFLKMQSERVILFKNPQDQVDSSLLNMFDAVLTYPSTSCMIEVYDDKSFALKPLKKDGGKWIITTLDSIIESIKNKKILPETILKNAIPDADLYLLKPFKKKEYTIEEFLRKLKGCPSVGITELKKGEVPIELKTPQKDIYKVAGFLKTIESYRGNRKIRIIGIPWERLLLKE